MSKEQLSHTPPPLPECWRGDSGRQTKKTKLKLLLQTDTCGLLQQHKHAVHRNKSLNLIEKVGRIETSLIFYRWSSCFHWHKNTANQWNHFNQIRPFSWLLSFNMFIFIWNPPPVYVGLTCQTLTYLRAPVRRFLLVVKQFEIYTDDSIWPKKQNMINGEIMTYCKIWCISYNFST